MAQRQTLICTGFEHGAQTVGSSKALLGASGSYAVQSTYVLHGSYTARLQPTGAAAAWIQVSQDSSVAWPGVGSFYFQFRGSLPSTRLVIFLETGQLSVPTGYGFEYDPTSGGIRPFYYDSSAASFTFGTASAAISADTTYRIEWYMDNAPAAAGDVVNLDWYLGVGDDPGTAQTRFTFTAAATIGQGNGAFVGNRVGPTSACDLLVDDVVLLYGNNTTDHPTWPLSNPIHVVGLKPQADGTHNNAAVFTDDGGASPPSSVANRLDELPWGDASADYVAQTSVDTAAYLETTIEDLAADVVDVFGGAIRGTFTASASGATRLDVTAYDPSTGYFSPKLAYTSGSTAVAWQGVQLLPVAPNELSVPILNRTVFRIGFSSDISPIPRCQSLMLEVAAAIQTAPEGYWGIVCV